MTEREKVMELLCKAPLCSYAFGEQFSNGTIEKIASYLLENGVVVVDTNNVKRENLPLIQQAFSMPLDELAQLVEAKQAGRIAERPCKVFDKTFLFKEKLNLPVYLF